jgi:hypothetical protein
LIGIALFVILIVAYFGFMYNSKEGFFGGLGRYPQRQVLIKLSTLDKFYNTLTDPVDKALVVPVLEIYKLLILNYDTAFDTSVLIIDANKEIYAAGDKILDPQPPPPPPPPSYDYEQNATYTDGENGLTSVTYNTPDQSTNLATNGSDFLDAENDYYARRNEITKLREKVQNDVRRTWSSRIDPGITIIITNIIKWLPTGKPFYDKLVLNNFYGLLEPNINSGVSNDITLDAVRKNRLLQALANTLYEDDQLSILLGPSYAKTTNPLDLNNQAIGIIGQEYINKIVEPFIIIADYAMASGNLLPDIIVNMISQLNSSLANNTTYQAKIEQLTGSLNVALANDATDLAKIGQLSGNLNVALANDATDLATITDLNNQVAAFKKLAGQSNMTPQDIQNDYIKGKDFSSLFDAGQQQTVAQKAEAELKALLNKAEMDRAAMDRAAMDRVLADRAVADKALAAQKALDKKIKLIGKPYR